MKDLRLISLIRNEKLISMKCLFQLLHAKKSKGLQSASLWPSWSLCFITQPCPQNPFHMSSGCTLFNLIFQLTYLEVFFTKAPLSTIISFYRKNKSLQSAPLPTKLFLLTLSLTAWCLGDEFSPTMLSWGESYSLIGSWES